MWRLVWTTYPRVASQRKATGGKRRSILLKNSTRKEFWWRSRRFPSVPSKLSRSSFRQLTKWERSKCLANWVDLISTKSTSFLRTCYRYIAFFHYRVWGGMKSLSEKEGRRVRSMKELIFVYDGPKFSDVAGLGGVKNEQNFFRTFFISSSFAVAIRSHEAWRIFWVPAKYTFDSCFLKVLISLRSGKYAMEDIFRENC